MNIIKKITYNAPVTLTFFFLCLLATILNIITNGSSTKLLFSTYYSSGCMLDPLFYVRLFTHVLGHADFTHFANNMMLFLLVAPLLEEKYGSTLLLIIILLVSFTTSTIHLLFSHNSALLGASGIVFALIILSSITGKESGIPLTLILVSIIYISNQMYQAIFITDNISQTTHIIGGILGGIIGLKLKNLNVKTM